MNVTEYTKFRGFHLRVISGPTLEKDEDGWEHNAYQVELTHGRHVDGAPARMRTPWRQGLGIKDRPKVDNVLNSLIMDAQGIRDANGFEDWAAEYGYDTDSRKAEKLYEQCKALAGKLHTFLGPDWFQEAMKLESL